MKKSEEHYITELENGLDRIKKFFYDHGEKAMGDFTIGLWWNLHYLKNDLNREVVDFTTPQNDTRGTEIEILSGTNKNEALY
jgi:hypothetical protein